MLREFLDLETSFLAFYGDMPINKERRCFIKSGYVRCIHPYWPEEAFTGCHPMRLVSEERWLEKLAVLNSDVGDDLSRVRGYAQRVAAVTGDSWSVDFAKAKDGTWYLIDMATGEESFHWPGCKFNTDSE